MIRGSDDQSGEVTRLLHEIQRGNRQAEDQLIPIVYNQLKKIATNQLRRESPGHSLQPTALVHEAYLRLNKLQKIDWQGRSHFFRISATIMRRILVDHARAELARKRGDGAVQVTLDSGLIAGTGSIVDILAVDGALTRLSKFDERQATILELHFFAGQTVEEIAQELGVSSRTVKRDWTMARAWMRQELAPRK
ncbi:MAG: sigma-70 family RNA polymerase sigma factor [Terracidiphilus sp.]|jgi:RNA polymerase sigma factor (TIGR02999 family)